MTRSALLAATPRLDAPGTRLGAISGQPPDLHTDVPPCPFASRCPYAIDLCREQRPEPVDGVACHRPLEVKP